LEEPRYSIKPVISTLELSTLKSIPIVEPILNYTQYKGISISTKNNFYVLNVND
jgi:hypothetical protein